MASVTVVLLVGAVVFLGQGRRSKSLPTDNVPVPAKGTLLGAHVEGAGGRSGGDQAPVEQLESELGRRLAIDHVFYRWDQSFPTGREEWDLENGRTPMISWNGRGALASQVAAGHFDQPILARAAGVKALRGPVFLRWFWEMDGHKKESWAESPANYIAAWRHIRSLFQEAGAKNVSWVWCPNASAFADETGPSYYPGPEEVDWICADGYNWAPGRPGAVWKSFSDLFAPFYAWASRQGRPLMIGEVGVQESGVGEKARWIQAAAVAIKTRFPLLKAVVYFNSDAVYDWRVETSPSAVAAFRAMGSDPWFRAFQDGLKRS